MLQLVTTRRLCWSSQLSSRFLKSHSQSLLPKSTPGTTLKRFSHGNSHEEYPPEYLFKKTSVFVSIFSIVTVGLVLNDRFNSTTGKSLVGDWLIPTLAVEEIVKDEFAEVERREKMRKEAILERSLPEQPVFTPSVRIQYVMVIIVFLFSTNISFFLQ